MAITVETLKSMLEFAPTDPGDVADNLAGWWTPDGYYVCVTCAGRIMRRGCMLPRGSEPIWSDRPEPTGVCCCCN